MTPVPPQRWNSDQLRQQLAAAAEAFRESRLREPAEQYRAVFDVYAARVRALLSRTDDLLLLDDAFEEIISGEDGLETLRYLAGPPISEDDLKTLADASLAPSRLRDDPEMALRVRGVLLASLDAKRFPWVAGQRRPDTAESHAAAVASAALMAAQRVQTARRSLAKTEQERQVSDHLIGIGLAEAPPRAISTVSDAPERGSFCRECMFGDRKADLVVHLHDGRLMPIECKVSNSATNSVKRLNNDAAVKASVWTGQFGTRQTVPSVVLSGVFKKNNLVQAQQAGLTIFWAHGLQPLTDFIDSTK